jgi:hypothetical protein
MLQPINELPPDYHEVQHLVLLDQRKLLLINLLAFVPLATALVFMTGWWGLVVRLRGAKPGGVDLPWWFWVVLVVILVIPAHEGLHGLGILWAGHKPRFGMMLSKGAFYATADNALFRRNEFLVVALLPLVGITLIGMAFVYLLPDTIGYYAALAVILNAGSAIGDLWMTAVALRYPPHALVRDEMDSMRVYTNA